MAASGGGLAIHDANRLIRRKALFDERHFADLAQRRAAEQHLFDGGFTKESHALIVRGLLHLGVRPPAWDHLPDALGEVQQFAARGAHLEPGSPTLLAPP